MAYSTVAYPADGVVANYGVQFPYLDKAHISVTVNGVSAAFTWLNDSTITVTALPTAGQTVFISRNSNRQARLTTFQDGQTLTQADLEADAKQLFYIAQEAFDAVAAGNGTGDMLRSNNLSDVLNVAAARANLAVAALAGATFSGAVNVPVPTLAAHAASKAYVDAAVSGSVTGVSSFNGRSGVVVLSTADVLSAIGYTPMNPAGAAMSGLLLLSGPPVAVLGAATKGYVDTAIAGIPPPTGEVNTMSSAGGIGLVLAKSGVNLPIRGLTAGAGVTLTQNATDIVIAATAVGGGEVNDGVNIAVSGLGPYASKSGVHLQFKGIAAGAGLAQVGGATDNSYSVNQAYPFAFTGQPKFNVGADVPDHVNGVFNTWAARFNKTCPATPSGAAVLQGGVVCNVLVPSNSYDFGWSGVFYCRTNSTVTGPGGQYGESVGLTGVGHTFGPAPIWAGQFIAENLGGSDVIMHGIEVDLCSPGLDPSNIKKGMAIYFGDAYPNTFNPSGPATRQFAGLIISPFTARNSLGYGITLNGNMSEGFAAAHVGNSMVSGYGSYSAAAIDLHSITSSPIGMWLAGGSKIKFTSGNAGNTAGAATWFPGAFVPNYVGALAVVVDATTLYIPVCNNHF